MDEQINDAEKDDRDIPPEDVQPVETPEQKAARELKEAEDAKKNAIPSKEPAPAPAKKNVNKAAKRGYSLKKTAVAQ